jgi:hypothetical protein
MKSPPIPRRAERLAIARLLVALAKELHSDVLGKAGAKPNFGSEIDAVFVAACVVIGHLEERPMTVTNVSDYLGARRTTVQRKLDFLVERGVIVRKARRYWLSPERVQSDLTFIDTAKRLVGFAHRILARNGTPD